ncbi:MAG: DUF4870 domain-containing protein [Oscillospiraceae bacterium]|nr:DUF4870 domain-containing protein [Oscillospiraceae bacterium]
MAAPQFEEDKKVVATVAVFPILFLIYFIAGKDSAYVRYCANQGLIFTILGIIISVVAKVIGIIPIIGFIAGIVFWLIDLAILVLTIYQMIGAFKGTIKPLPVIGDVEILK